MEEIDGHAVKLESKLGIVAITFIAHESVRAINVPAVAETALDAYDLPKNSPKVEAAYTCIQVLRRYSVCGYVVESKG